MNCRKSCCLFFATERTLDLSTHPQEESFLDGACLCLWLACVFLNRFRQGRSRGAKKGRPPWVCLCLRDVRSGPIRWDRIVIRAGVIDLLRLISKSHVGGSQGIQIAVLPHQHDVGGNYLLVCFARPQSAEEFAEEFAAEFSAPCLDNHLSFAAVASA
jgi:hypothetical protein